MFSNFYGDIVSSYNVPIFTEKAELKKELEDEYKSMLEKNQREMEEMQKSFNEKLAAAQATVGKIQRTLHISNTNI